MLWQTEPVSNEHLEAQQEKSNSTFISAERQTKITEKEPWKENEYCINFT